MKPIQLTIQAFGSYGERAVIDFTKPTQNLFLVTGDTGAGKTTIFDAIVYALYGDKSEKNTNKNALIPNLQSQFATLDVTPFVELAFSETVGGRDELYIVHRVPHHRRKAKRGNSEVEEKESVTLTLPDHTDYPGNKEAVNEKLRELVGLTKEQFMQVGMIAQGDFMRILRAPTSDKREIFRRLFNTEIFDKIVSRLGERNSQYREELQNVLRRCQTKAEDVVVPENFPQQAEMEELVQKIRKDKMPSLVDFETLQSYLKSACEMLIKETETAAAESAAAQRDYDAANVERTKAEALQVSFDQLAEATERWQAYKKQVDAMTDKEQQAAKIQAAYGISGAYETFDRQRQVVAETEALQQQYAAALPEWEQQEAAAGKAVEAAKQEKDKATEVFGKVQAEVKASLEIFAEVATKTEEIQRAAQNLQGAKDAGQQAQQKLDAYQKQLEDWRQQVKQLPELSLAKVKGEQQQQALRQYEKEIHDGIDLGQKMKRAEAEVKQAMAQYQVVQQAYQEKRANYEREQQVFLNAQAGLLAESLVVGQPCPVCGSREHPQPQVLEAAAKPLAREELEHLAAEVTALNAKQQAAAETSGKVKVNFDKSKEQFDLSLDKLRQEVPGCEGAKTLNEIRQTVRKQLEACEEELRNLTSQITSLETIQRQLDQSTETLAKLQEDKEDLAEKCQLVKSQLETAEKTRKVLLDKLHFATQEEAKKAQATAREKLAGCEKAYDKADKVAKDWQGKLAEAKTVLSRCQQELPGKKRQCQELQLAYQKAMQENAMSEETWQEVVRQYEEKSAAVMQQEVQAWRDAYHAANGSREAAQKAVAGKALPDLAALREKRTAAQAALQQATEGLAKVKGQWERNERVRAQLNQQLSLRVDLGKEACATNNLYERLSGKRSGARMDIETYVQRYYLRQILGAANRRFRAMSGGQFELKMLDDTEAARGGNHGLDLKVLHTVTGKERAIQTLSGGESFMAALSLALGLSDQIQANMASIHLDVLFIDEGFGSLDDNSRNEAVHVLQKMAGSAKLIGIISHVTELKQEIDNQLVVTKNDKGSHVAWQIS
ncbi:exonuclease SbcC [Selenomonas sp. WCT3]|uniref:AAA family ATPase n=1 Tax=Selenomonas sp. WCT3 TaxID=3158785 RepID=UPI0008904FD3|nr:exonuclease SbcC [Selenomonas ruminantium]